MHASDLLVAPEGLSKLQDCPFDNNYPKIGQNLGQKPAKL